jgi:3,4-dihydroxy-2-butanone 4-phosphate synthase
MARVVLIARKVAKRKMDMLFVRGDGVILVGWGERRETRADSELGVASIANMTAYKLASAWRVAISVIPRGYNTGVHDSIRYQTKAALQTRQSPGLRHPRATCLGHGARRRG